MAEARGRPRREGPRRLPRGRHALDPEVVLADQRERLVAAVPPVVAERGYEAMSVADLVKRAAVSRNAFYRSFRDKQDCFAAAHERGHERLFGILAGACEGTGSPEEKLERSLAAALDTLAAEPELGRLLFVEAPGSAGEEIALRYHEWLRRYGSLLHGDVAGADSPAARPAAEELDQVIVGGIATRIASEVLRGGGEELRDLTPHLVEYLRAFAAPGAPGSAAAEVVALEPGQASGYPSPRRRRAGA